MFSIQHLWARTRVLTVLLLPLAFVFLMVSALRREAYRRGWLKAIAVGVPVIIVGNITAGGSGKTPLVIWLANWLRTQGYQPGVVSRGYGGSARGCVEVQPDSLATEVGDEPLLIRRQTGVPVWVGRDRVAAARDLIAQHRVDIIVADDGLQHYRLHRDLELAVVDAATGLGNGWPLPAGPLREPVSRLQQVDAVIQVVRGTAQLDLDFPATTWRTDYTAGQAYRLRSPLTKVALPDLPPCNWLAITGIGRPQGFFDMLQAQGLRFKPCAFSDHHAFKKGDIPAERAVLMTEKDAVKCLDFAGTDWWAVELTVTPEPGFSEWLGERLK